MMTLSIGAIAAQAVTVLIAPVLGRIYSPGDFGILGIFTSYATIISVMLTGRYEMAILLPRRRVDAYALACLSLLVTAACIVLSTVILAIFKTFDLFPGIASLSIALLIPYFVFYAMSQVLICITNREERYRSMASGSVCRSTVQGGARVAAGIFDTGAPGLIWGSILGLAANTAALLPPGKEIRNMVRSMSWRNIRAQALRYRRFPLYELPGSIIYTISNNLAILLLAIFFSDSDIGNFTMAVALIFLPVSFITTAQSKVFYKQACMAQDKDIRALSRKIFACNFIIGAAALSVLECFGREIFSFFLGNQWCAAGDYAVCLAPWTLMMACVSPISSVFLARNRQNVAFAFNLTMLILRSAAIFVGALVFHSMLWSALLYGIAGFMVWSAQGYSVMRLCGTRIGRTDIAIVSLVLAIYMCVGGIRVNAIL